MTFLFREVFRLTTKSTRKYRGFSSPSSPPQRCLCYRCEPTTTHHCHAKRTASARRFTLGVTHSVGFDKCIMRRVLITAPCKVLIVPLPRTPPLWAPSSHSPPSFNPTTTDLFIVPIESAFSRMSRSWNCTVCRLLTLASFPQ